MVMLGDSCGALGAPFGTFRAPGQDLGSTWGLPGVYLGFCWGFAGVFDRSTIVRLIEAE